ncbi:MAG TPA: VWA domain-containing protein [Bryobacteraceae bacterium]|jgi:VWFA-related protein
MWSLGEGPEESTQLPGEETPVISVDSRLVVVQASVRNRSGEIVSGLGKSDFTVFEDGHRQSISVFLEGDVPVAVGLVVDNSGSMKNKRADVTAASVELALSSNPRDRMFVINFNEHVRFGLPDGKAFSSSVAELEKALERATPEGETALYDAVSAGLSQLEKSDCERRVLIVVSDGGDNASHHNPEELLKEARRSDAVIYTVGLFDEDNRDSNPRTLHRLAGSTGGEAFFPRMPSEVVRICRQIAKDIRTQYTIGYSPANTRFDGRFRRIKVRASDTTGEPLSVRARAGYVASGETR